MDKCCKEDGAFKGYRNEGGYRQKGLPSENQGVVNGKDPGLEHKPKQPSQWLRK